MKVQRIGKSAIDMIYTENVKQIYQIAYHYTENHHTAQDITQQVFMKLYINADNINMNHVQAWLRTTAKHMAINERKYFSRKIRKREILVADIASEVDKIVYLESLEDDFINKLDIKARAELAEKLYEDLYHKNERWYEAITITYILQKPQKEVAETMGISLNSLQVMLYRAKNWIRKRYQKQYEHLNEA